MPRCGPCQPSKSPPTSTPLPRRTFAILLVIILAEAVASTYPLPFAAWLVVDLPLNGSGGSSVSVGAAAGVLAGAYFAGQLLASPFWGRVADRFGRRPVLLIGLFSNIACALWLGFASNWVSAAFSRFVNGFLNSSVPIVKTCVRDATDESNQARGYSIRSSGYAVGTALGPLIGGALARPFQQYSGMPRVELFSTFPYLLPCLVSACLSACGLFLAVPFLQESLSPSRGGGGKSEGSEAVPLRDRGVDSDYDDSSDEDTNNDGLEMPVEVPRQRAAWTRRCPGSRVVDTAQLRNSISIYGVLAFCWLSFDSAFAIWSMRDLSAGGLSFSAYETGLALSAGGAGMLLFQLFVFVPLERKLGTWKSLVTMMGGMAPTFVLLPICARLLILSTSSAGGRSRASETLLWIVMAPLMAIKTGCATSAAAAVNLAIANGARPSVVGSVNGVATVAAASARLMAPVLGMDRFFPPVFCLSLTLL
jgi:MFS family permease